MRRFLSFVALLAAVVSTAACSSRSPAVKVAPAPSLDASAKLELPFGIGKIGPEVRVGVGVGSLEVGSHEGAVASPFHGFPPVPAVIVPAPPAPPVSAAPSTPPCPGGNCYATPQPSPAAPATAVVTSQPEPAKESGAPAFSDGNFSTDRAPTDFGSPDGDAPGLDESGDAPASGSAGDAGTPNANATGGGVVASTPPPNETDRGGTTPTADHVGATSDDEPGLPGWALIGLGAVVVVAIGLGLWMLFRNGPSAPTATPSA